MGKVLDTIGHKHVLPHLKVPTFSKKEVLKTIDSIYETENDWMTKYISNFIMKKYIRSMKTKYGINTNVYEIKKIFRFYKKRMELMESCRQNSSMPLLTIKFPKFTKEMFSAIQPYYPNINDGFFTSDFWFYVVDMISQDTCTDDFLKKNITNYFNLMIIVDAVETFTNRHPYKYIESEMGECIDLVWDNVDLSELTSYTKFGNFFVKNKELTLNIKITRMFNLLEEKK